MVVFEKFSNNVTLPAVFHSEGWSTKSVTVFVVLGGTVKASSVGTAWSFALISEVVLTCIVNLVNV